MLLQRLEVMADDEAQDGADDPRMATLQQYTLKTMKQKNDKWSKVRLFRCNINIRGIKFALFRC